jgi:hypothetical protein
VLLPFASATPIAVWGLAVGVAGRFPEVAGICDVDFAVFAAEGEFDAAWEQRHRLHPADAFCWDYPRPPGDRDVAAHRWLTTDFVLFDGLIATPAGTGLTDPMHVLVGGEALTRQLVKREPVTTREQHRRSDEFTLHEVERLYGELKLALRAHRRRRFVSRL